MSSDFQLYFVTTLKNATVTRLGEPTQESQVVLANNNNENGNQRFNATNEETVGSVFRNSKYVAFCFLNFKSTATISFLTRLRHAFDSINGTKKALNPAVVKPQPSARFAFFKRLKAGSGKKKTAESAKKKPLSPAGERRAPLQLDVILCPTNNEDSLETLLGLGLGGVLPDKQHHALSAVTAGWGFLSGADDRLDKHTLSRVCRLRRTPEMALVDSETKEIINSAGRLSLNADPNGSSFPWFAKTTEDLLNRPLLRVSDENGEEHSDWKEVDGSIKALLFGANWCLPCKNLVKQLAPIYLKLKADERPFEVIYCPLDRSEPSFKTFLASMPWWAFALDEAHSKALANHFGVDAIPSVVILDEENHVITRHGRSAMLGDPDGVRFPWHPEAVAELNEVTVSRLRDEPSFIVFTEGSDEDIRFATELLSPIAERELFLRRNYNRRLVSAESPTTTGTCREAVSSTLRRDQNGNDAVQPSDAETAEDENDGGLTSSASKSPLCSSTAVRLRPLQYFYGGDSAVCDQVLAQMGAAVADDAPLPLVCIVDAAAGLYHVCDAPDVSDAVVRRFAAAYRAGALTTHLIQHAPTQCQTADDSNRPLNGVSDGTTSNGSQYIGSP